MPACSRRRSRRLRRGRCSAGTTDQAGIPSTRRRSAGAGVESKQRRAHQARPSHTRASIRADRCGSRDSDRFLARQENPRTRRRGGRDHPRRPADASLARGGRHRHVGLRQPTLLASPGNALRGRRSAVRRRHRPSRPKGLRDEAGRRHAHRGGADKGGFARSSRTRRPHRATAAGRLGWQANLRGPTPNGWRLGDGAR
jgi:hypothetical protein